MKPFLLAAVFCSLAVLACHKKADSPRITPTNYYWQLVSCEFDGPVRQVYLPPDDSITEFNLYGYNNQYLVLPQKWPSLNGHFTLSPDSILNFDVRPILTADSSWRLPQQAQLRVFHGDSMVISDWPILPSSRSTFTFVKVVYVIPY